MHDSRDRKHGDVRLAEMRRAQARLGPSGVLRARCSATAPAITVRACRAPVHRVRLAEQDLLYRRRSAAAKRTALRSRASERLQVILQVPAVVLRDKFLSEGVHWSTFTLAVPMTGCPLWLQSIGKSSFTLAAVRKLVCRCSIRCYLRYSITPLRTTSVVQQVIEPSATYNCFVTRLVSGRGAAAICVNTTCHLPQAAAAAVGLCSAQYNQNHQQNRVSKPSTHS